MFSIAARRVTSVTGRRNMGWRIDFANKTLVSDNNIEANRLKWDIANPVVGAENPTFLKKGMRSKVVYYGMFAGLAVGFLGFAYGEYSMIMGINQKSLLKDY